MTYVPVQYIAGPLAVMMLVLVTFLKRKELGNFLGCARAAVDVNPDVGLMVVLVLVGVIRVMNLDEVSTLKKRVNTNFLMEY
jgi:hypothetical protein